MLTVMHRHDDGTETIYECASVSRACRDESDPTVPPLGDLILHGCPESTFAGNGAVANLSGQITIRAGCRSSNGFDPMAFVMNRFGATVATYRL